MGMGEQKDATALLTDEDTYNFDVAGYLHLPRALDAATIAQLAAADDDAESACAALLLDDPRLGRLLFEIFCDPSKYIIEQHQKGLDFCGFASEAVQLDGSITHSGAQSGTDTQRARLGLSGGLQPNTTGARLQPFEGGTDAEGVVDMSRSYFNTGGHRFAHGLRVVVPLAAGEGGQQPWTVVCGSHKSSAPTPPQVREGRADAALRSLGLLQQPTLVTGDVLVISTGALCRPSPDTENVLTLDFVRCVIVNCHCQPVSTSCGTAGHVPLNRCYCLPPVELQPAHSTSPAARPGRPQPQVPNAP